MGLYPDANTNSSGLTYRHFQGKVRYPFGFGLSFTTFKYSNLVANTSHTHACDTVGLQVDVTNTGSTVTAHDTVAPSYHINVQKALFEMCFVTHRRKAVRAKHISNPV